MSLLNDMLRDLSHAQKNNESGTVAQSASLDLSDNEQRELIRHSSLAKPARGIFLPSLLAFFVVSIILLIGKQGFFASLGQATAANQAASTSLSAPEPARQPIESNELQNSKSEAVDGNISVVKNSTELLNERLAALETAITTLSKVVEQQVPVPASETVATLAQAPVNAEQETSVSIRDPFVPDSQAEANNAGSEYSDTIPDNAHLAIAPNPEFLDQRKAEQGRYLFAQGQVNEAILELKSFITNAQAPRESVRALLDILSHQEDAEAMDALLKTAGYLDVLDQQFYAAKAAIIQNREGYAVELLEAHLTEAEGHENYRALLAGLYQRTGKYLEAATSYRRLLGSFGEKPAYWLGFALAQDSLNERQTAKQAYLRLAQYPGLQPQVQAYIQQRLAALQQ